MADLLEHNDVRLVTCRVRVFREVICWLHLIDTRNFENALATAAIPLLRLRITPVVNLHGHLGFTVPANYIGPSKRKHLPLLLVQFQKTIWRIILMMLDDMGQFDCDCLDGLVVSLHLLFQLPGKS